MMKLFWSIITIIYYNLILIIGLRLRKIKWLFNQPNYQLETKLKLTILADPEFTSKERAHIIVAIDNINFFCNGFATI